MGGLLRSRSDAATCQTLAPQWPIVEDAHVRLTRLAIDRVFLGCCRSISQTQKGGVICLSSCSPVFICFFFYFFQFRSPRLLCHFARRRVACHGSSLSRAWRVCSGVGHDLSRLPTGGNVSSVPLSLPTHIGNSQPRY